MWITCQGTLCDAWCYCLDDQLISIFSHYCVISGKLELTQNSYRSGIKVSRLNLVSDAANKSRSIVKIWFFSWMREAPISQFTLAIFYHG